MQDNQTKPIGNIIEPEPVLFTFDAPGWTILLVMLLLALILIGVWKYIQYRKNAYRREAIQTLEKTFNINTPAHQLLFQLSTILKQVSIASYGREEVAALYGEQWLSFLEEKNRNSPLFPPGIRSLFVAGLYQGNQVNIDNQKLQEIRKHSVSWIKNHHV